jgi:hypothetical protein
VLQIRIRCLLLTPGSGIRDGKIRIRDQDKTSEHITNTFTEIILNTAGITITALQLGIGENNLTDGLRYNDIRMNFHVRKNVLELSVADLEQHVLLLVQNSREPPPAVSARERPLPCSGHGVL